MNSRIGFFEIKICPGFQHSQTSIIYVKINLKFPKFTFLRIYIEAGAKISYFHKRKLCISQNQALNLNFRKPVKTTQKLGPSIIIYTKKRKDQGKLESPISPKKKNNPTLPKRNSLWLNLVMLFKSSGNNFVKQIEFKFFITLYFMSANNYTMKHTVDYSPNMFCKRKHQLILMKQQQIFSVFFSFIIVQSLWFQRSISEKQT
eukprot:TRINITY_DN27686_c0_g2_i8.p1 TRINITY_DN27686_c0_g2~~TRINITY_DN27686_c0_g2_i8.p1  ORF type:complete len:203 (+),score=-12.34 TRINITY_DN27686_c0_g2_i8:487-1095(+)